jgi:anti-sigma regulatory factor (Ser/Thr protein kinase)
MRDGVALALPARTESIAHGRWFVDAASRSWAVAPEVAADAVLATSECVTNAVLHGAPPVRVAVIPGEQVLRVEVQDGFPVPLPAPKMPSPTEPGGRGLVIIDAVARAWGAAEAPHGKCVWFEVETTVEQPADELSAVEQATLEVLASREPFDVVKVLTRFVERWGGRCAPPGQRPGHELPVDVSFGLAETVVPVCPPDAMGRRHLEYQLPRLAEDARMMVDVLTWLGDHPNGS